MAPRGRIMREQEALPESDRAGESPHPREARALIGHDVAQDAFKASALSGKLHHAWLISGPKGIGKSTFAWKIVRYLLRGPKSATQDIWDVDWDESQQRLITALSHPDLFLLRRPWDVEKKRFKSDIPAEDVRNLPEFFSKHSSFGGHRVAVVDCADDLNEKSQNALLKIMEEPPSGAILLLISHIPGALLPTTRSRCRSLALKPLQVEQIDQILDLHAPNLASEDRPLILRLANGSAGRALELAAAGAMDTYRDIAGLLGSLPKLPMSGVFTLADRLARQPFDKGVGVFTGLLTELIERQLRDAHAPSAHRKDEDRLFQAMRKSVALTEWEHLHAQIRDLSLRSEALNLDKKQVVLTSFFAIEAASRASEH